jgi:hypothetical protein
MRTTFIDSIRERFKHGGFAEISNNKEEGGCFLVGVRGRLFSIESDYQVGESASGYSACGSGAAVSLGSLFSTHGHEPYHRVRIALEAAQALTPYVLAPFTIMETHAK